MGDSAFGRRQPQRGVRSDEDRDDLARMNPRPNEHHLNAAVLSSHLYFHFLEMDSLQISIMRPSRGIYTKPIPTGRKPLTSHFHPSQWEFFRVLRGNLTIEFRDGELAVPTYTHHVMYWIPRTKMNEIEFVMSASDPAVDEEGAVVVDQPFLGKYGY
ncbi:unnamed protein product [Penicillium viridicatum]